MALVIVQVQGADGVKQPVLLDKITGQIYAIPIYKMSIGTVGTDDGVISADNPLPIKGDVGHGDAVDLGNIVTVGLTKGIPVFGTDGLALQLLRASAIGRLQVDELAEMLSAINDTIERVQQQLALITGIEFKPGEGNL